MKKILVIDDDDTVREFVSLSLRAEGYAVIEASDGREGVESARQNRPDLVISDVSMRNLDGYGVVAALRADPVLAAVPLILMTAEAGAEGMRRGMVLGADDYLPKPFHVEVLYAAVKAQEKKQQVQRQYTQSALETLRSNLSLSLPHELNTPLNGIIGFAEMLKNDAATLSSEEVSQMATFILESGNRLYRVAHNYLTYAQVEMWMTDPVRLAEARLARCDDVGERTEAVARKMAEQLQRTGDLQFTAEPGLTAAVSPEHLEKIFEELMQNAFKFSRAETAVTVRCRREAKQVRFVISDRGRGMTRDQVASLGAYAQFDRKIHAHEGLGLGLIIARRLVDLYAGQFSVDSEPATGTTVTFCIPA